jgi:hypothetical protein
MKVLVLREAGYEEAVLGFSLSYNTTIERTKEIISRYAYGIPGENKFLESIQLWLDVTAPRFWWQEADTYRVGSSKQSESTMHTICKRELEQDDFEFDIPDDILYEVNYLIRQYKEETESLPKHSLFVAIKNSLPEGFLQRRIWNINYKVLQNIYVQRYNHKLPQWKMFLNSLIAQIEHSEFIIKEK